MTIIDLMMWFWSELSIRNWTFEGRKLRNPFYIVWIIMMLPILNLFKYIYLFMYMLTFGWNSMIDRMEELE